MKGTYQVMSCMVLLLWTGIVQAQGLERSFEARPTGERMSAVKINILSPFYSTLNLSYQRVINPASSINLTASYMDFDSYGSTYNPVDSATNGGSVEVASQRTKGFTVMPEYRYTVNGRGLSGIYLAPFLRYAYYEYSQVAVMDSVNSSSQFGSVIVTYTKPDFYAYHTVALGCIVGKQILFKNRISVDFFCGPVYSILVASNKTIYNSGDVVLGPGIPPANVKGYGLRAGITVGFVY
jgi:hypothetical protein